MYVLPVMQYVRAVELRVWLVRLTDYRDVTSTNGNDRQATWTALALEISQL